MHAIAFICKVNETPIAGLIVQVLLHDGYGAGILAQGITNQDGYVLFNYVPINIVVDIYVWGAGVQNYTQTLSLGDTNQNYSIGLKPSFKKPSRERIINVKANLCNIYDADDWPIFDSYIDWLIFNDLPKANDWIERLTKAGSTHINIELTGNYPAPLRWNNNQPYPIPGADYTQELDKIAYVMDWLLARGKIPILKLGFDGQAYSPEGWTYGWQWGMDNIERIANGLSKYNELILWSTGYDGCFPDWSPQQTIDMLRKMRSVLGDKACIDTEFGAGPTETWSYTHLGNGGADWVKDKLGILDHFSLEAQSWPPTETGLQTIGPRLLGPKAINCPSGPYYLQGLEKEIAIDVYETWTYKFFRKECTPQDSIDTANMAKSHGYSVFGNGLPSL